MNDVTRTSNEWATPWRASALAVYDAKGTLVAHTGITGNRTMPGQQLERMAAMIAEAVNRAAHEPPAPASKEKFPSLESFTTHVLNRWDTWRCQGAMVISPSEALVWIERAYLAGYEKGDADLRSTLEPCALSAERIGLLRKCEAMLDDLTDDQGCTEEQAIVLANLGAWIGQLGTTPPPSDDFSKVQSWMRDWQNLLTERAHRELESIVGRASSTKGGE